MNKLFLGLALAGLGLAAQAAGPRDAKTEELRERLASSLPGLTAEDIRRSPIDGIFEISRGLEFGYVTADGKYLLTGDLIDLDSGESVTENSRKTRRLAALEEIGEAKMIVFPAKKQKHVMTVFTDIDCGYCRKLHQEMDDYHAQGITVRYLFYPRSGPNTESFKKASNVWCAADQHAALTEAKSGRKVADKTCDDPVMQHFQAGQALSVRGTPALILDDGSMRPGYIPAARLAQELAKLKTK